MPFYDETMMGTIPMAMVMFVRAVMIAIIAIVVMIINYSIRRRSMMVITTTMTMTTTNDHAVENIQSPSMTSCATNSGNLSGQCYNFAEITRVGQRVTPG